MATKTKTIAGVPFEISQPYEAGHALTEAEAKVLNQTRSENIGNNCRKKVVELIEADDAKGAQAHVAQYDKEYEFTLAVVGASRKLDPVEKEARAIARESIKAKLAAEGRKLKDIDKERLAEVIAEVSERDAVVKEAKKRVAARNKASEDLLEDLDI